jgi:hypothetical protein
VFGGIAVALVTMLMVWGVLQTRDGRLILDLREPGCAITVSDVLGDPVASRVSEQSEVSIRLPPGEYRVEVSKTGFLPSIQNVTLSAGQQTRLPVPFQPLAAPAPTPPQ